MAHTMTTSFKDSGEEAWPLKLHIGCGGVYLNGYMNIDIQGSTVSGPGDVPDENKARVDEYYTVAGSMSKLPKSRDVYVDKRCSFTNTGLAVNSVDKIVCIQTLEHVSYYNARIALLHWWNIMKAGAPLLLSVPDSAATLEMLLSDGNKEQIVRLLQGSLKDSYAAHLSWYDEETLIGLLTDMGFCKISKLPNPHFYPAITIRAEKYDPYMADRAYQQPMPMHLTGRVLDVGPGVYPHPKATHFLDIEERDDLSGTFTQFDLDQCRRKKLPYGDNYFEYVHASHVIEHLKYPRPVVRELQRIGKHGYIEVPGIAKDLFLQFGEEHNHWDCVWGPKGELMMVRRREETLQLYSQAKATLGRHMHIATHSLVNTLDEDQIGIRKHFWENQHLLNIWTDWSPESDPKIKIMG